MTPDWQERMDYKLDKILDKLEVHNTRLAHTETSVTWLKWLFTTMTSVASIAALAYSKYIGA